MVLALLIQTLMLAFRYRRWQVGLLSVGALLLGLTGIVLFGLQKGLGRWMETSAYEVTWNARLVVYEASSKLWWAPKRRLQVRRPPSRRVRKSASPATG